MGKKKTFKQIRESRGISRMTVAEKLGIHYNTLINKETGKSEFTMREGMELAKLYGVDVTEVKI